VTVNFSASAGRGLFRAALAALVSGTVVAGTAALAPAADWLQFRTAASNSVSTDPAPPVQWSETENVAWKVDLPGRGPSSPIVIGDRVVVTASSGVRQDRLHVLCFDVKSGKSLWERQFWATGRTLSHPASANAACTPASDGKLILAFFSSNDLLCLDLEGNLKWLRGLGYDFPQTGNDVGMASSPAILGDTVVVQIECQGDSFAAGIDKTTGESRWRLARPNTAGWTSPVVMQTPQRPIVLLQSTSQLTAHDPHSGQELWAYRNACDGISSAVGVDGVVYVPSKGMTALRPNATSEPEVLWNVSTLQPGAASPIANDGRLYLVNRAGVLVCASQADGQALWRVRLSGEFWGTPALAGNRLYAIAQNGGCQVVEISADGSKGEIVGQGQLDGTFQCSPAISAGALYVRSDQHLWKIAAP
jgi:outer membrane protein assembly factor BamB